jgi:hypothetical protein
MITVKRPEILATVGISILVKAYIPSSPQPYRRVYNPDFAECDFRAELIN